METDKVALEIPSPATGVLTDILVREGETVPVGTLLARLDGEPPTTGVINRVGGVVVKPMEKPLEKGAESEPYYSPAVKQLAKEHGVDLSTVTGTGLSASCAGATAANPALASRTAKAVTMVLIAT